MPSSLHTGTNICRNCAACVHCVPDFKHRFWLQDFAAGQDFSCDILRYDIFLMLLEGNVELLVNQQKYILHKGEMLVLPLFSVITTKALSPVKVIAFTLAPDYYHLCISRSVEGLDYAGAISRPLRITPGIESFLQLLLFYIKHIPGCRQMHIDKYNELGRLLSLSYNSRELAELLSPLFRKEYHFIQSINKHLDSFTSVENMAEQLNMSMSVFNKTFKAIFNTSPYKWLLKRKSYAILQYISLTNCTVNEIIDRFIFTSPSHFHRFCRSQYRCTPGELFKKTRGS